MDTCSEVPPCIRDKIYGSALPSFLLGHRLCKKTLWLKEPEKNVDDGKARASPYDSWFLESDRFAQVKMSFGMFRT
jgi:hypothetical protein